MTNLQPLPLEDFSGGMTDYYLGAALNKFQQADNFLLYKHGQVAKLITRPGSVIWDEDYPRIPSSNRISALHDFDDTVLVQAATNVYYLDSGWQTLTGPSGNTVLPTGTSTSAVVTTAEWNNHVFISTDGYSKVQKIFRDGSNALKVRTAGLPGLASTPTATSATPGSGISYIYAFCYKYEYQVGTLTFIDRGPVTEITYTATTAASTDNVTLGSLPVISNGSTDNYDTTSIKLEIYRTTDGGQLLLYVGEVTNGTTSYVDNKTDAALAAAVPLYTSGGVVDNDAPPLCKYIHITEDHGYFANVKIGSEVHSNRVYQSIGGDIDSVPATFYCQVDGEITGLSSVKGSPIVFCKNGSIYRIEGRIDYLGQGDMTARKIAETAPFNSPRSIVQTLEGIFFAGMDGFYFCDGYTVDKVNDELDKTFKTVAESDARLKRIYGVYDSRQRRIWWAVSKEADATDNDTCFILDLNYGVTKKMPFTTATAGESFAPSALLFVDGSLLRADTRGYIFEHAASGSFTDPKVDTSVDASEWEEQVILYDYRGPATDFGTLYVRKFVPRINVVCQNETNLSLQINVINDDGRKIGALSPVRFRGNVTWGDPNVIWGDPTLTWNYEGLIDEWRRVPANNLRCSYMQVQLTNAVVAIISSDELGTVEVNSSAKTATLTNSGSADFPGNLVDYYIAFSVDNYSNEYLITAVTSDVVTYSDTDGRSQTLVGSEFVIRGKPKGEILSLLGLVINYTVFGQTQGTFTGQGTGEVGAG